MESFKLKDTQFWGEIEDLITGFITSYQNTDFYENAKYQGWLGHQIQKDGNGLLGYMRTSFAIQKKAIDNLDILLPIPFMDARIVNFFRSDFIRDAAREKGYPTAIYKKEHFQILLNEVLK